MIQHFCIAILAAVLMLLTSLSAYPQNATLPPLTDPPSGVNIPGKFVWADLFSADVAAAKSFYRQLFGWQWQAVEGDVYSIAFADDRPVAGLVLRPQQPGETARARWIYYASIDDVYAAAAAVEARGGRIMISPQTRPQRGDFAIFADPAGALFGVMRSSSGDPGDYREPPGRWIWIQLLTPDVTDAAEFYSSLLGYEVYDQEDTGAELSDRILASSGYARAGVTRMTDEADLNRSAWTAFIRVTDIQQSVNRARELGGEIVVPPAADLLDAKVAIIRDPLGAALGLLEWRYPEESAEEQP